MTLPNHFRILAESQHYILGHVFEWGSIIDRRTGFETAIGDSYGDPDYGIIDKNETWALLFGHSSYLWTSTQIIHLNSELSASDIFSWPHDARQVNDYEVEILDDPWSDSPGIYSFNILTKELRKIREFTTLKIPYDQNVRIDW